MKTILIVLAFASTPFPVLAQETSTSMWGKNLLAHVHQMPQIEAARERMNAEAFNRDALRAPLYNPSISAQLENDDTTNFQFGINQTLDLSGKRKTRQQLGTAQYKLAGFSFDVELQSYLGNVLTALAGFEAAARQKDLALAHSENLKTLSILTKRRLENGDLGSVDGALANYALSAALPELADAENAYITAEATLKTLLGDQYRRFVILPGDASWRDSGLVDTKSLVEENPRVVQALQQFQVAKAEVNVAKRNRRADPTVGVIAGRDEGASLVGLNVSVPLNIRNSYKAPVKANARKANAAEFNYQQVQRSTLAELEGALATWRANSAQLTRYKRLISSQENEGLSLLKAQWAAGDLSTADYVQALSRWQESVAAGIQLQRMQRQSLIAWLSSSGQITDWLSRR